MIRSTPQGYGFLLPFCLAPSSQPAEELGKEKGIFWTVSFLEKSWDQCCFEKRWDSRDKAGGMDAGWWVLDSIGWDGMDSGAGRQTRELHSLRRHTASGKGQGCSSILAGQGAADRHIQRVNVSQWKRKCPEKPESIACSLQSLMLAVFPALGERWKVPAAATGTA